MTNRVLVAGVGRSGTSWTTEVLGRARDTVQVQEPDSDHFDPYARVGCRGLPFHPVLRPGEAAPDFCLVWELAFQGGWPLLPLARRLLLPVAGGKLTGLALRRSSPAAVVVKTVRSLLSLEWIAQRFQPRELGWRPPPLDLPALSRVHPDLVPILPRPQSPLASTAWGVGVLLRGMEAAARRNPHWWMVRHEWLCEDPVARFASLSAELGLPWSAAMERYLSESDRPGQGYEMRRLSRAQLDSPWRGRLSSGQVAEARAVLEELGIELE